MSDVFSVLGAPRLTVSPLNTHGPNPLQKNDTPGKFARMHTLLFLYFLTGKLFVEILLPPPKATQVLIQHFCFE